MEGGISYWTGVFTGLACSLVLCTAVALVSIQKVRVLQEQMTECEKQVAELSKTVEEDRKIMQTYKFFNETWSAIIQLKEEEEKDR